MMNTLAEDASKLTPKKDEHYMHVLRALAECYQSDVKQGIVLVRDDASESDTMTLIAISGMSTADSAEASFS